METVIVQAICDKSGRCFSCGGLVYAVEKQRTTKHIYHDRCFRCRICKRNLNGSSLNEDGDEIYCSNCYRKKLRGECQNPKFERAALEKANYIYNEHHPELTQMKITLRPQISRQPSLLLRKIERKYLSLQEENLKNDKDKLDSRPVSLPVVSLSTRVASVPHLSKIRSVFQVPIALGRFRLNRRAAEEKVPSPPLKFSPVFSPSTDPLPRSAKTSSSSPTFIRQFLFNSDAPVDLNRRVSLPRSRKLSFSPDLKGQTKEKQRKFSAPELGLRSATRRSLSVLPNRLSTIREFQ